MLALVSCGDRGQHKTCVYIAFNFCLLGYYKWDSQGEQNGCHQPILLSTGAGAQRSIFLESPSWCNQLIPQKGVVMRRLFEASIWGHDAIPASEWKYRNLKRIMLPTIDFFFFIAGFSGARFGVPAISEFFPDEFVDIFSYTLSGVALICFVGVAFPRMWRLEIFGKSILFGLMVGYFIALFILTAIGEDSRGFVVLVAAVALSPIVWRLSLLGSEWQDRRVAVKAEEAARQAELEEGRGV